MQRSAMCWENLHIHELLFQNISLYLLLRATLLFKRCNIENANITYGRGKWQGLFSSLGSENAYCSKLPLQRLLKNIWILKGRL